MDIDRLIDEVIGREGGYVDHPADRGGPTRWGVTQQVARAYGYAGDMRVLPRSTAAAIYKRRYWSDVRFDDVADRAPDLAGELFDAGINMGPERAAGFLQRALNVLNRGAVDYPDIVADGRIGPMTLHALDGYIEHRGRGEGLDVLLFAVRCLRGERYAEIIEANPSQEVFSYGWFARMVRAAA